MGNEENQHSNLSGFRVKVPDIEIEFRSTDNILVKERFDEVLDYLKQYLSMTSTTSTEKKKK